MAHFSMNKVNSTLLFTAWITKRNEGSVTACEHQRQARFQFGVTQSLKSFVQQDFLF